MLLVPQQRQQVTTDAAKGSGVLDRPRKVHEIKGNLVIAVSQTGEKSSPATN
jgi:hypothetical protein